MRADAVRNLERPTPVTVDLTRMPTDEAIRRRRNTCIAEVVAFLRQRTWGSTRIFAGSVAQRVLRVTAPT
ncbi:hypothetical protein ACFY94_25755 [Streptomyces griseorubiginosus]|uniref:hypothetical protein n=1 Tax=Streptomyces griseorubiginosus TaxID=67304 RepID=UPI0036E8BE1B